MDRINADDAGGQYDSSGGADGDGNPAGSVCTGYVSTMQTRSCLICVLGINTMLNCWNQLVLERVSDAAMILMTVLLHWILVDVRQLSKESILIVCDSDVIIKYVANSHAFTVLLINLKPVNLFISICCCSPCIS